MTKSGPRGPYSSGLATREAILAAATEVFARAGDTGFGMRDIAKVANVSHPTVCYHFESRIDLMRAVYVRYETLQGVFEVGLDDRGMVGDPHLRYDNLADIVFQFVRTQQRPDSKILGMYDCRMLLYAADADNEFNRVVRVRSEALKAVMNRDIERMQREGHCTRRLNAETLTMLILNSWIGVAMAAGYPQREEALSGSVRFIASVIEILDLTPEGMAAWVARAPAEIMPVLSDVKRAYDEARVTVKRAVMEG